MRDSGPSKALDGVDTADYCTVDAHVSAHLHGVVFFIPCFWGPQINVVFAMCEKSDGTWCCSPGQSAMDVGNGSVLVVLILTT